MAQTPPVHQHGQGNHHDHNHGHAPGHGHGHHHESPDAGPRTAPPTPEPTTDWDVVIVGGASAGLSAALMLGRARRRVLVVDAGHPRNEVSAHMHGVLGHDGVPPADLYRAGRTELARYDVAVRDDEVVEIDGSTGAFTVAMASGTSQSTRRVIIATGMRDELPPIPGLAEQWGRGAFVCPYCDGYERRDRRIGVLATGPLSGMQVQLLRQWSSDVVYLPHLQPDPAPLEQRGLDARGIEVATGLVQRVLTTDTDQQHGTDQRDNGELCGVELADGSQVELDVLFTMPATAPHDALLRSLGASLNETPFGEFVAVDATGLTSVPGVWAVGNVTNPAANVVVSMAAGALAAGAVNHDLVEHDVQLAVAAASSGWWETRYRDRDPNWAPNPNVAFVHTLEQVRADGVLTAPGTALELGAGHGADALWLANQGWQVTATDISPTALERIAARATEQGLSDRVTTAVADATAEFPPGTFDLVYAAFTHLPEHPDGARAITSALAALNPGGVLLLLDHGSLAPWMRGHGPMPSPQQMVAAMNLDAPDVSGAFDVLRADTLERTETGPGGDQIAMLDNVVMVRRVA